MPAWPTRSLAGTWGAGTWMFQLPTETDSTQFFYRRADFGFEDFNDHSFHNCGSTPSSRT